MSIFLLIYLHLPHKRYRRLVKYLFAFITPIGIDQSCRSKYALRHVYGILTTFVSKALQSHLKTGYSFLASFQYTSISASVISCKALPFALAFSSRYWKRLMNFLFVFSSAFSGLIFTNLA